MIQRNETIEIIKDVREYLRSLADTGVAEICTGTSSETTRASGLTDVHDNTAVAPAFIPGIRPGMNSSAAECLDNGVMPDKGLHPGKKPADRPSQLQTLREKIGDCRQCKLWKGRHNIVFGTGNPEARLMFVGEGPGQEEDRQGKPFVGRAGELLTKMIAAMRLSRDDVYIANVVKCRPPDNRNPEADEISACRPYLKEQIRIIRPEIICALGTFAAQTLLDNKARIGELRGKIHHRDDCRIVATFHPAYLLRNQNEKRRAWEDLQLVMRELGLRLTKEIMK